MRLQDGRIKVYIHVADPTRHVQPGSMFDKDAMKRGTSVFLPTATYPMYSEKLARQGMRVNSGSFQRQQLSGYNGAMDRETVATFGSCNNIPSPYTGQPQSNIDVSAFAHLPGGPVRSSAKIIRAAEIDFRKPT